MVISQIKTPKQTHFIFIFHCLNHTLQSSRDHNYPKFSYRWSRLNFVGILLAFSTRCLKCLEASRQDVTRHKQRGKIFSLERLSLPIKGVDFKTRLVSSELAGRNPQKRQRFYLLIVGELPLTVSQREGKPRRNVTCVQLV